MTATTRATRPSRPVAVGIGLFAGGLSGLFGVGGGILIVPALAIVGRMEQRLAHGTSLAATAPLALAGLAGYAGAGEVDWVVAGLLLLGSGVGAVVGTSLLHRFSQDWLRYGFAVLLLATAARMLIGTPEGVGRGALEVGIMLGLAGIGLFSGSIAGLMGVGGGIVMVPAQILLFAIPSVLAKGTSLAVIVPTAILGTLRNLKNQNAQVSTAAMIGGAGVVSSFLASQISIGLDPRVSAVLFAALLAFAAVRLLLRNPGRAGKADGGLKDGSSP